MRFIAVHQFHFVAVAMTTTNDSITDICIELARPRSMLVASLFEISLQTGEWMSGSLMYIGKSSALPMTFLVLVGAAGPRIIQIIHHQADGSLLSVSCCLASYYCMHLCSCSDF